LLDKNQDQRLEFATDKTHKLLLTSDVPLPLLVSPSITTFNFYATVLDFYEVYRQLEALGDSNNSVHKE
jgi:hypothetical protein